MDRVSNEAHEVYRAEIKRITALKYKILEEDKIGRNKLLENITYSGEDIRKYALKLFKKSGYDFGEQFKLFEDLKEFENLPPTFPKPIFVIYAKPNHRWILLVFLPNDGEQILYKDPTGAEVYPDLKNQICRDRLYSKFLINGDKDIEDVDKESYGPVTLRNLGIVLEGLKNDYEKFIDGFSSQKFCKMDDRLQACLLTVVNITESFYKDEKFKEEVKKLLGDVPIKDFGKMLKFVKVDRKNGGKFIDFDEADTEKKKILAEKDLDSLCKKYKDLLTQSDGSESVSRLFDQFPEQNRDFKVLFNQFNIINFDPAFFTFLEKICWFLNVPFDLVKKCYNVETTKPKVVEEKHQKDLTFEEISSKLPRNKPVKSEEGSTLEDILEQIKFPDKEFFNVKNNLRSKYQQVEEMYQKWAKKSPEEVNTWAKSKKLKGTPDDIYEMLGVLSRGYHLVTGDTNLGVAQILAILICQERETWSIGRLCQVKEGKSLLVALLAIVQVWMGHKVDIITNEVEKCKITNENLYRLMDVSVGIITKDTGEGYQKDVVYGTMEGFYRDYLGDSIEGFEKRKRGFDVVVFDEVDDLLIDEIPMTRSFPGMSCLRYIYINIWRELISAEEEFTRKELKKIEKIVKERDDLDAQYLIKRRLKSGAKNVLQKLKDKILEKEPMKGIPGIPSHLVDYIKEKEEKWIDKAIEARFVLQNKQDYTIKENVVVPYKYQKLKMMDWSDGLQQFLQLKENLRLTIEGLPGGEISKTGFIKLYKRIYGVGTTLGSLAEKEYFSNVFKLNYAEIPPLEFKSPERKIIKDDHWSLEVSCSIGVKIKEKRSVLVIFQNEKDLEDVRKVLQAMDFIKFKIRSLENQNDDIGIGEVLLETYTNVRTTIFKTNQELEKNGGLHVVLGFLPVLQRVEDQVWAKGSAESIIKVSEVTDGKEGMTNQNRNTQEYKHFLYLEETSKELDLKDHLFQVFAQFLKDEKFKTSKRLDLFEFWCFWLRKQTFDLERFPDSQAEKEFERFKKAARPFLNPGRFYNLAYGLIEMRDDLKNGKQDKSIDYIEDIISNHKEDQLNDYPAFYLRSFETSMLENQTLLRESIQVLKPKLQKIVGDNIDELLNHNHYLFHEEIKQAYGILKKEVDYIKDSYLSTQIDTLKIGKTFKKILVKPTEENLFLQHFLARYFCLDTHLQNYRNIVKYEGHEYYLSFKSRPLTDVKLFEEFNLDPKITQFEINDLHGTSLDSFYVLEQAKRFEINEISLTGAQVDLASSALAASFALPFLVPVVGSLSIDMLIYGINITLEEILRPEELDKKRFYIAEAFSLPITALTVINGMDKYLKRFMAELQIKFQSSGPSFRNSSTFLKIYNNWKSTLDGFPEYLKNGIENINFLNLTVDKQVEYLESLRKNEDQDEFLNLGGTIKLMLLKEARNGADFASFESTKFPPIFKDTVLTKLIGLTLCGVFDGFQKKVKTVMGKDEEIINLLKKSKEDEIIKCLDSFLESHQAISNIFDDLWTVLDADLPRFVSSGLKNMKKFRDLPNECVSYLKKFLQTDEADNDESQLLDKVSKKLRDDVSQLFYGYYYKYRMIGSVLDEASTEPIKIGRRELIVKDIINGEMEAKDRLIKLWKLKLLSKNKIKDLKEDKDLRLAIQKYEEENEEIDL